MLWPEPAFKEGVEPHFLFIVTPPNSGSTAIAKLLNTSCRTMLLEPRGEGQWLVPGLCENDRWNPDKVINYKSVRSVWLSRYQAINELVGNIDVVIEKSPPNMMRIMTLASQFNCSSILANNRDPYASISSRLFRRYDVANMGQAERTQALRILTREWVVRSKRIRDLVVETPVKVITYEEFCNNPYESIKKIEIPEGVIESIDINTRVRVKDYRPQKITNQNQRQIDKLEDQDLSVITELLFNEGELLAFFGYRYIAC